MNFLCSSWGRRYRVIVAWGRSQRVASWSKPSLQSHCREACCSPSGSASKSSDSSIDAFSRGRLPRVHPWLCHNRSHTGGECIALRPCSASCRQLWGRLNDNLPQTMLWCGLKGLSCFNAIVQTAIAFCSDWVHRRIAQCCDCLAFARIMLAQLFAQFLALCCSHAWNCEGDGLFRCLVRNLVGASDPRYLQLLAWPVLHAPWRRMVSLSYSSSA